MNLRASRRGGGQSLNMVTAARTIWIAVYRFGNKIPKVEPAAAFVHGRPLPSQSPVAGWTNIDETTAVNRACGDEAQIPDSPPDGALPKTSGAQAWALIIQIVRANRLTVEQSLIELISS